MHIGEDVAAVLDLPYDTMRRGFYVRDVGMTIAARMPRMAITVSNSMRVRPADRRQKRERVAARRIIASG